MIQGYVEPNVLEENKKRPWVLQENEKHLFLWDIPSGKPKYLLKIAIYSGFSH